MSILGDIINKKVNKIIDNASEKDDIKDKCEQKPTMYNKIWLSKVVEEHGFTVTDNEFRIENILRKLNEKDGYCPCGGKTEDSICPCKMMRQYGACKCGLYQNIRDINPTDGSSEARIK